MQTTYRLKAQEMSTAFLKSLKTLFAGQEIEITVRSVETVKKNKDKLLTMMRENRMNAPVISAEIDVRALIDEAQYPDNQV